jgi:site-specific DNA-methyltransferase (adenine-specific)
MSKQSINHVAAGGAPKLRNDNWATPQRVYDQLNAEFNFHLDAAANRENAKHANFLGPGSHICDNAFDFDTTDASWLQEKVGKQDIRCFLNPPYSQVARFMEWAYSESRLGTLFVCLVPAATETAWFQDIAMRGEVRFWRGRIQFVDPTPEDRARNTKPSTVVIYRPGGTVFSLRQYQQTIMENWV